MALLAGGAMGCGGGDGDGGPSADASPQAGTAGSTVGAGSTSQEFAQEAWVEEFNFARLGGEEKISYDPVGSYEGRRMFIDGEVAFAASDTPLEGAELEDAVGRCKPGRLVEIPVYISSVVIAYNISNTFLEFTPAMLVKILKGEFAYWDAPAIRRENPSISSIGLPHVRIVPIYRSDESGTTENLTEYLSAVAPDAWPYAASGTWPLKVGKTAKGTLGMIDAIYAREGNVGYLDASQVSRLGQVSPKVGREYVSPSGESVARAFGEAVEVKALAKSPYMFPFKFDRKTDSRGVYPIAFVSYLIACTAYDSAEEAAVVREYLEYVTSSEAQALALDGANSVPLPPPLVKKIQPAIAAIG